jgi:cyclic lactone autoinducer peptide
MLKKVIDRALKLSCGALGAFLLFLVGVAAGTMSAFGIYEPQMPDCLIPTDGE